MSVGEYYYVGQKPVEKFMLRLHNIMNRMEYHGTLVSNVYFAGNVVVE